MVGVQKRLADRVQRCLDASTYVMPFAALPWMSKTKAAILEEEITSAEFMRVDHLPYRVVMQRYLKLTVH